MMLLHKLALLIGYAILAWYGLKLVLFLFSIPRFFPKAIDDLEPEKGMQYTKYVFTNLPWVETRVWRHVYGPFYIRCSVDGARADSIKRWDTPGPGGLTRRQEKLLADIKTKRGVA